MLKSRTSRVLAALFTLAAITLGYATLVARDAREALAPANRAVAASPSDDVSDVPHGRWRLAPGEEIDKVVVFVSHLLVRHVESNAHDAPFGPPGWKVLPEPPARTREQALALARSLAEQARRDPSSFSRLAEQHSDDPLSRARGGSLGALSAAELAVHPRALDAFALLAPGEVSGVVQTSYGFHVLKREALPAESFVAGRHLVIAHERAGWLDYYLREGRTMTRPHADALALAKQLKQRLDAAPDQPAREALFAQLVREHSDHRDADQDGDIGVWSSREASSLRWELRTLEGLAIGEVSEPFETPGGLALVLRSPPEPRETLTMAAIKLPFNPNAKADDPYARAKVIDRARAIAKLVRDEPGRFPEWQKQYCCTDAQSWTAGRNEAQLTELVRGLSIDGVASEPLAIAGQVMIVKRLAPEPLPTPLYELPAPSEPDLDHLLTNAPAKGLARYVRGLPQLIGEQIELRPEHARSVADVLEELGKKLEVLPVEDRLQALGGAQLTLRAAVGDEVYQQCMTAVREELTRMQLAARN